MKKLLTIIISVCTVLSADAQTMISPQTSTTQTIKQNFALSFIELTYSRPRIKGRKIFGGLVPYGEVWRTGANNANALTFGDTVFIQGTKINPGTYGLASIPNEKSWVLIISNQLNITGPEGYKKDQDVVRFEAITKALTESIETFTILFANLTHSSCDLQLMWDKTMVTLPITTNTEKRMLAQIDQLINHDNKPYFNAAMYYMNNGLDLTQALAWFGKALEQEPELLRNHNQRANCLVKMGRKEEAKMAARKGLELAKAQKHAGFTKTFETLLADLNK